MTILDLGKKRPEASYLGENFGERAWEGAGVGERGGGDMKHGLLKVLRMLLLEMKGEMMKRVNYLLCHLCLRDSMGEWLLLRPHQIHHH